MCSSVLINPCYTVPSWDEKVLVVVAGVVCESETLRFPPYAQDPLGSGLRAKPKA